MVNKKLYKECDVVMLPTNNSSLLAKGIIDNLLACNKVNPFNLNHWVNQHLYILSDEEIKEGDWILNNLLMDKSPIQVTKEVLEDGLLKEDKKIIATSDKFFKTSIKGVTTPEGVYVSTHDRILPQIPQSFIEYFVERYNKGNVIDKVFVEYEEEWVSGSSVYGHGSYDYKLKINPDNIININIKESWNIDEVNELINSFEILCKTYQGNQDWFPSKKSEWLKENLLSK